jgi:1,4-alpha-glucan branching enzyme
MAQGYLALHLHAHLPFVRHPEHPTFLEERWFFDAIVDTYVPLIRRFEQLHTEGVPFRLSMTMTPTLLSMFADGLLQERFRAHLDKQRELADREFVRTADDAQFRPVVEMYQRRLNDVAMEYARFGGNFASAFRMLADMGHLELTTCGATHGFLPHMQLIPGAVARQLRVAVETHQRLLGRSPDGIWLPECAYYPGLERELKDHGLLYFFADSHALTLGLPRSLRGVHSHVYMENGVAAFGRDVESSRQVWSAREGYPGDVAYRDFYRDIGFDLPREYMAPYIHLGDTPILTGFKYYAITGDSEHKVPYQPEVAQQRIAEHAAHFVAAREEQVRWLSTQLDRPPVVVSPYDAELFGHWWYEGPEFLYHVLRLTAQSPVLDAIAAKDYLLRFPYAQVVTPNASSWGSEGYYRFWLNGYNEWVYPHLNAMARLIPASVPERLAGEGWAHRALRQAERELLLAQSSDWPFIMSTGTSPGYAAHRIVRHLHDCRELLAALDSGIEPQRLSEMEERDNLF